MRKYYKNRLGWTLRLVNDKEKEEFHITPVITLSTPNKKQNFLKWGYALAFEWGFWAIFIGVFKSKIILTWNTQKK